MKILFDTDDHLPLNKPLKLRTLTIIVRSAFEKTLNYIGKFIQMNLSVTKMIQLHKIEDSKGTDLNKFDKSKECKICYYN